MIKYKALTHCIYATAVSWSTKLIFGRV